MLKIQENSKQFTSLVRSENDFLYTYICLALFSLLFTE